MSEEISKEETVIFTEESKKRFLIESKEWEEIIEQSKENRNE